MTDTIESLRAQLNVVNVRIAELEDDLQKERLQQITDFGQYQEAHEQLSAANQQIAAQALTIKTMRSVLEKFLDSHEECTDFDGFTAQIVSMDDYHEAVRSHFATLIQKDIK